MVKQFRINLNRQEGYAQRLERRRKRRERGTLIFITLVVLVVVYLTWSVDNEFRDIVSTKERQLENIVARIDSLQKAGQNVSKQDVIALARLDAERVLWTKKLAAIAEIVPEQMAVSNMEFDRNTLTIQAITPIEKNEREFDKVKALMDKLKATPQFMNDFDDIKFKQSERYQRGEQELLGFTITCRLGAAGSIRARRAVGSGAPTGSPDRSEALTRQLGG